MANVGPCFLASLVNSLGFNMFFTSIHYPSSPFVSSLIFGWAVYFFVVQISLYPKKFRRLPGFCEKLYEFLATMFILEFSSCNIWFPLETFAFLSMSQLASFLKRSVGPRSLLFPITSCLSLFLQNYTTGIAMSYTLSISSLMIMLHASMVVDLCLIRRQGIVEFVRDAVEQLKRGACSAFRCEDARKSRRGRKKNKYYCR